MVLTRSQEDLSNMDQPSNCSFTVILDPETTTSTAQGARPKKTQRKNQLGPDNHPTAHSQPANADDSRFRQIVSDSLQSFRVEMQGFISNELRNMFQNMNTYNNISPDVSPNNYSNSSPQSNNNVSQNNFSADKILNIVRNWRIKFSGHDNQMSVDEFIYRINILTVKNLNGNLELLCDHAHCLFEGKALEWFWRYHRKHDDVEWIALTNSLRDKYKVDYNDFDILEDIRRRKQKPNETFDEYLDTISALTDKLKSDISDCDLCEILLRNLRGEIRQELIHLEISNVSQLRREVKKHERFVKELHVESRKIKRVQVAELTEQRHDEDKDVVENTYNDDEICAVQHNIKCWNCDKIGHTFFDCMETRRIFCYGCGVKDIYKPNCPNCNRKAGNDLKDVRRK